MRPNRRTLGMIAVLAGYVLAIGMAYGAWQKWTWS